MSHDPLLMRKVMQEMAKRKQAQQQVVALREPTESELELANVLEDKMYAQQRGCWLHPAKRKVLCGSRRIGKSTMLVLGSCITLLRKPSAHLMYVSKTLKLAKPQYFDELRSVIREYSLPFDIYIADLKVEHQRGGGAIHIKGAETQADIDNLVGYKLTVAMLDESGRFGAKMESAVMSKIGPSLRDTEGTLILTGTPSDMPEGLFYEAVERINPTFEYFHWDMRDNPFLPASAKNYDQIIAEEGFSGWDDPRFIREYLGKFAVSIDKQVFQFVPKTNLYKHADLTGYEYLIGVDFGVTDASAVVVLAYMRSTRKMYVVESWTQAKVGVDEIAEVISVYKERYNVRRIIGDQGGLGKAFTEELWRRHQLFIEAAAKRDKLDFIAVLNSALKSGNLMIPIGSTLAKEIGHVIWNDSRTAIANHSKDDTCHALLYAFRAASALITRDTLAKETVFDTGETIDPFKEALFKHKPEDVEPIDTENRPISDFKW